MVQPSLPQLWRLNVRFSQIGECIRTSLFAFDRRPRNPEMRQGDYLLLQLVKTDAVGLGKQDSRIEFALVYDHLEEDRAGTKSTEHWPDARKTWRYIVYCSQTVATVAFSLERLGLGRDYGGQSNPQFIEPDDALLIWPYIGAPHEISPRERLREASILGVLRNWDRIVREGPERTTTVREHARKMPNTILQDLLKIEYDHHCQVCEHDFKPRYGVPFAEVYDIGGGRRRAPLSTDLLVVCPNHNRIIVAAEARFDRNRLAFEYRNGLIEPLKLRNHLQ